MFLSFLWYGLIAQNALQVAFEFPSFVQDLLFLIRPVCKPSFSPRFLGFNSVRLFSSCLYRNVAESPTAVAMKVKFGVRYPKFYQRAVRFCVADAFAKAFFFSMPLIPPLSPFSIFVAFFSFKTCFSKTSSNSQIPETGKDISSGTSRMDICISLSCIIRDAFGRSVALKQIASAFLYFW